MIEWNKERVAEIIRLGRTGMPFGAIAREAGTSKDNARKRWWFHARIDDRAARHGAVGGAATRVSGGPKSRSRSNRYENFNMGEPAVPRPRCEIEFAGRFADDPRAVANHGSHRRPPAAVVWALGGTSLA